MCIDAITGLAKLHAIQDHVNDAIKLYVTFLTLIAFFLKN